MFEEALTNLDEDEIVENPKVFQNFANFEERRGEHERARLIYLHAVKLLNLDGEVSLSITQLGLLQLIIQAI